MMNYHALLSALLFLIAFIAPAAVSAYHLGCHLLDCHRSIHSPCSITAVAETLVAAVSLTGLGHSGLALQYASCVRE